MSKIKIQKNQLRPMPPSIGQQSTVLSSWVVLIYRLLEYRGLDAKQVFADCELDSSSLVDPAARIPHFKVGKIWQQAAALSVDESLGLDAAKVIYPGMFHWLSMAMSAAPNLLVLLQYMARYRRVFQPLSRMQMVEVSDGYRFVWGPREPYVSALGSEAVIASLIGLCRQLKSPAFSPKSVLIKRELSEQELARYEDFFQAPVSHGKHENSIFFDRAELQQPLLTANPEAERLSIKSTKEYIGTLDENEISNTVYCKIVEALPSQSHSEDAIAEDLNMSLRTMQRRLRDAGTSYDKLLQDTRKELALSYIKNPDLSIQEVSYLVGFSEPTNFSRAFKRWTGSSPASYRAEI
jgi:AraC-like DNA-binding protein